MSKFYDTNALLELSAELDTLDFFYTSSIVLQELEHIKTSRNKTEDLRYKARCVSRFLRDNDEKYECVIVKDEVYNILHEYRLPETNDNLIVTCAYIKNLDLNGDIIYVSNDICCYNIAKNIFNLNTEKVEKEENDNYKGYKEIQITDEELADLYSNTNINTYDLLENEYLIIKNENGEIVDKRKWTGTSLDPLKYKTITTRYTDKVKPRNVKQEFAFDMLQNSKIKLSVLEGYHGAGKTLLMIANALELIEKGKYSKIIWVVQNEPVENTTDIGALPGELNDKLLPFTSIFADKVGGQFSMEELIANRKLEVIPLAFIRGRSFKDAVVMMTEAENTTVQHMKLLISRLEEDSMLMIDGDFKQTDNKIFKSNNGLRKVIDTFKGIPEFGVMTLTDVERSRLANLASLLD